MKKEEKNVEQKHQRAIEEGVKMEKSCEIFSTKSQQVVKSAMQGYGFITMNNGWCLYFRNLVICFLLIEKEKQFIYDDKKCSRKLDCYYV